MWWRGARLQHCSLWPKCLGVPGLVSSGCSCSRPPPLTPNSMEGLKSDCDEAVTDIMNTLVVMTNPPCLPVCSSGQLAGLSAFVDTNAVMSSCGCGAAPSSSGTAPAATSSASAATLAAPAGSPPPAGAQQALGGGGSNYPTTPKPSVSDILNSIKFTGG